MNSRIVLIAAAVVALSGCTNTMNKHIGEEDPGMGEAVKYNAALQTINPAPVYPAQASQPGDNGDKGAHAVKRYRSDQVKPVETMETTASGSSAPH